MFNTKGLFYYHLCEVKKPYCTGFLLVWSKSETIIVCCMPDAIVAAKEIKLGPLRLAALILRHKIQVYDCVCVKCI